MLAPAGIEYGTADRVPGQFQAQTLLARRYPDLLELQFSCYSDGRARAGLQRVRDLRPHRAST